MKTVRREPRHALRILAAALLLPALFLVGCSSGVSGHAPGLAGEETQDPGQLNFPMAYIKRPPPTTDINALDLITSTAGGDVYIRQQATAGSPETNISGSITKGLGDARDLDVSVDGTKLVFSLRLQTDPTKASDDPTQPTWKIYEYDASTQVLTQLTNDATTAGHDISPHFLPDGRIVFASTRQAATQAILIDEGRPQYPAQSDLAPEQPIFLLHVMNADGTNIHQISFNTDHDFAPSVMANGKIVFSRVDTQNGGQISLYQTNPDGTGLQLLYGENSHATGANLAGTNNNVIQFLDARARADAKLLAIARPLLGTQGGGDILLIDAANFVEINQGSTPVPASGAGQQSATQLGVTTDSNLPSLGGRFASAYPLYDGTNRMLVSWAPCLVLVGGATEVCDDANSTGANVQLAPPQYTVWLYDFGAGTLSPILGAEANMTVVDPVIMQVRTPAPTYIPDTQPIGAAADLANASSGALGVLDIRSVYDFDGVDTVSAQTGGQVISIAALADPKQATAAQRPARFLRVQKAVEIPGVTVRKIDPNDFGPAGMGMREILAYVPIEPDGSVRVELPADVPFTIDVLDVNGRRISALHSNWLQLMPGETKSCNGCHTVGNQTYPSHGRSGLTNSVYAGAPAAGAPFPDTVASLAAVNQGDTMAETRALDTCVAGSATACSAIPSIDIVYQDVWTNPATAGRPADAPFSYLYANLSTAKPASAGCAPWGALCRSTIHYPLHLQPIWQFTRQTLAANGTTVIADHTCTNCHTSAGPNSTSQVPDSNLDLTNTKTDPNDATILLSYLDLVFQHNEQIVDNGSLQDLMVPVPGSTTGATQPVILNPPMTAGSAILSQPNFLSWFDGTNHGVTVDHTGFLTTAELRLISEWLDIGAQYYNDPFVAPTN